jgi:hypothetical protein
LNNASAINLVPITQLSVKQFGEHPVLYPRILNP